MSKQAEQPLLEPEQKKPSSPQRPKRKTEVTALAPVAPTPPPAPRADVEVLMLEAIRTGNLEVMERVMAIRRELKAEAAREQFFAALSAFQHECPVIKKTKVVKSASGTALYSYAPLDQIVKAVGPLLTKHGLSYNVQSELEVIDATLGRIRAVCHIYHKAGHSEESQFLIPIKEPTQFTSVQQQFGAANTYAKRYAFTNALGILTEDEDTDARLLPNKPPEARQPVSQPRATPSAQKPARGPVTPQQTASQPKVEPAKPPNGAERPQLEPTQNPDEAIDEHTVKGLQRAMEHAALDLGDFRKRFPALEALEKIKRTDSRAVLSWIADPVNK